MAKDSGTWDCDEESLFIRWTDGTELWSLADIKEGAGKGSVMSGQAGKAEQDAGAAPAAAVGSEKTSFSRIRVGGAKGAAAQFVGWERWKVELGDDRVLKYTFFDNGKVRSSEQVEVEVKGKTKKQKREVNGTWTMAGPDAIFIQWGFAEEKGPSETWKLPLPHKGKKGEEAEAQEGQRSDETPFKITCVG